MLAIRSDQEIQDFARGCTFMGTGGGGDPRDGIAWLKAARDEGKEIAWVNHTEIQDDAWTVCPFLMGSIAPLTEETKKKMQRLGLTKDAYKSIQAESVRLLEEYMDVKVGAIVAIELGGSNTPGAVAAASRLGIPAVDGDYTGRAIPEIPQTTPYLNDLPLWPISSVDKYGNLAVIKESTGYEMAERIGKFIAAASFGLAGQAGFLFKGSDMKRVVIPGTLTTCLEIGRSIRESREAGRDPVREIIKELDGWLLFEGEVSKKEWEDKEGYYWGTHTITGLDDFKEVEFKIWFKNENHVSWLNGKPYVTSPDMLIVVNRETGEPLANFDIAEGQHVAVIGLRAIEQFRSPKGIDILGPRHFGYEIDYTPIETLVKQ
ncbi:DUF917 domain-containing protein [Candidatus Bipolaricaulota bacterium]|nr:DUF917 domain-containing protein [Candidatus Bipolaricaulota bacterium]MCK4598495.1 DUF917 domain-containing protein [Candidatus Bipolaricaulota bacterium]